MNEKILDMSVLSQLDYEKVKSGWDKFNTNTCARYFGYIDKKDMKNLCRTMNYVDGRSFVSGMLFIPVVLGCAYVGHKIHKFNENKQNKYIES